MPRSRKADADEHEEGETAAHEDVEAEAQADDVEQEPRDDPEPEAPTTVHEATDSEPEQVRDRRRPLRPERRRSKLIGPCNVYRHLHDPDRDLAILKAHTSSDHRYRDHDDWEFVETVNRTPDDYIEPEETEELSDQ